MYSETEHDCKPLDKYNTKLQNSELNPFYSEQYEIHSSYELVCNHKTVERSTEDVRLFS